MTRKGQHESPPQRLKANWNTTVTFDSPGSNTESPVSRPHRRAVVKRDRQAQSPVQREITGYFFVFFFIVIAQILPLLISLILVTFQPGYFFSAPITAAADVGKLFLVSRTVFWLPRKLALAFNGAAFSEKITGDVKTKTKQSNRRDIVSPIR